MKLWTAALYMLARWEVSTAHLNEPNAEENDGEDRLSSGLIPSVAPDERRDRILADIDQDGFIFAAEERDTLFFNRRETMAPRKHHRVQIVLTGGAIRVRKSVLRSGNSGMLARLRDLLQWEFYLEAAALLRLRGLAGVPTLRRIDAGQGVIEMDYIWGSDLRQVFADGGCEVDYGDVSRRFSALLATPDSELSCQIVELLANVMKRGVIPRDIHAANFIRARRSRKVYLVDFHLIYLRPVPGWRSYARHLASILGNHPGFPPGWLQ